AAAFGGLVFKDALGIPLGTTSHMAEELRAENLPVTCQNIYDHVHEATWSCLLSGGSNAATAEPLINKVNDVNTMLLLSVFAAFVHLLLGMVLGIRHEIGHGAKHVGAKVGFLVLLLTFYPAVVALLRPDMLAGYAGTEAHAAVTLHLPFTATQAYMFAGVGFVLGAILLGWAEGFAGVLEIPSVLSAIMSYLRLGAVAIAKGAMAVAFNALTLVAIGLAGAPGVLYFLLALVAFVLVQVLLFVLGMLSAGIQALRLNFVEFFTKFYKGGGTPFRP